jgi:hypothetical protein
MVCLWRFDFTQSACPVFMASARRSTMVECGCAEARDEGHDTAESQEWMTNHLDLLKMIRFVLPQWEIHFFWGRIYREYDMFYVLGVPKSNINSHSSGLTTFSGGSNYNKKHQFLLERDVPKNSFYHVLPCFTAYYHSMYFVLKLGLNKGITL